MTGYNSIGDRAQSFQMQNHSSRLKAQMQRLSRELTTGQTEDVAKAVRGDFTPLAGIERSMAALSGLKTANSEAALFAQTMQAALGQIQSISNDMGPTLLSVSSGGQTAVSQAATVDAKQKLASIVSVLNTGIAGRSVFAGIATDSQPIASADLILAELNTAIAAETTASGVIAAVDAWFDAPAGGFETLAYQGSTTDISPFRIGMNESAGLSLRADDQVVRDTLKAFALAALVNDGTLASDVNEQGAIVQSAGERMLSASGQLSNLRAEVGAIEGQIESAAARNSTESNALQLAHAVLIGVDPYEAASQLEATQGQLETLYTLTARLSRLTLADFL